MKTLQLLKRSKFLAIGRRRVSHRSMGKYSQLYRELADLVRTGKIQDMEPKQGLKLYPKFTSMNATTFRAKLREIRKQFEDDVHDGI